MRIYRQQQARRSNRMLSTLRIAIATACAVIFVQWMLNEFSCPTSFPSSNRWNVRGTTSLQDNIPFDKNGVAQSTKNLIIVAGHSVTVSGHLADADHDEEDWYLLDYQRGHGLPEAVVAHIEAGIKEATEDEQSLLVFSGGATRPTTGPDTEGASYFRVADAMSLWSGSTRARATSEDFAKDSFENLSFSICRFYEVTGRYPEKITMVSYSFKRRRFEELHAAALRWPTSRFYFVGVDPPASSGFDLESSTRGEMTNAAQPFESDPYGCHSDVLREKRSGRNPFHRRDPYPLSCPDMKTLLSHCGPDLIATEMVPWSTTASS